MSLFGFLIMGAVFYVILGALAGAAKRRKELPFRGSTPSRNALLSRRMLSMGASAGRRPVGMNQYGELD